LKKSNVHLSLIHRFWIVPALVAVAGMGYGLEAGLNAYVMSLLANTGISILLAVSLNWVIGITGQFSLGHAGLMAVGAYTSALLSLRLAPALSLAGLTGIAESAVFSVNLLIAGLVAAFFGFLLGLPSLRLKGDYLAIVTLGFGEVIRVLFLNIDTLGGARGLPGIPNSTHFFDVFAWVLIALLIFSRILNSPEGRALKAVREDPIAAQALGIGLFQFKLKAFVLGAFFAGVAGGLYAHFLQYINPQGFDFNRSFEIMIMVVLGGMGSLTGSVVAAALLTVLKEALRPLQELTQIDFRMILYSLALIILMLLRPQGLFGSKELSLTFIKRLGGKR